MAFIVHRWKRGVLHESVFFVRNDIPLPERQALERTGVTSYLSSDVLRIAAASKVPVRWVYRMIAPDDRADVACKKILYEIVGRRKLTAADVLAAWRKDGPILFRFEESQMPASPFVAVQMPKSTGRTPRDHEWIGTQPLNIALMEDMNNVPEQISNLYIWSFASVKTPAQQDVWMTAFFREATKGESLYQDNDVKFIDCTWNGLLKGNEPISLERIFAKLHTSVQAPLIQWLDDRHHILYKLDRKHKLPTNQLETLTKYERIPLTGPSYIAATITDNHSSSVNSRISISNGAAQIQLRPNMVGIAAFKAYENERVSWSKEWLGAAVKSYSWALSNATVRIIFSVDSSISLSSYVEAISKYTTFLNVKRVAASTGAGKFVMQWLRASNYKANVDISNVINARLRLGIDTDVILNDLVEINGLTLTEARSLLDGVIMVLENPENVNVREQRTVAVAVGLTMLLTPNPKGIEITMRDVASYADLEMAMFWLQGMFKVVTDDLKKGDVMKAKSPSPKATTSVLKTAKPDSLEDDPFALSSSNSSSGGSFNFIVDLQKADPQLFANNYSKRCQSASDSQPVVMSQSEFAALDAKYKSTVSSHIVYGSSTDVSKHHVYFCPTIWCSASRVPMSYQQYVDNGNKCPDGKEGMQIINDADKKRKLSHIGFYSKSIEGAEPCLPCCYAKELKAEHKSKCTSKVTGRVDVSKKASPKEDASISNVGPGPVGKDYLLTHAAPLAKDRWGTLPRSMHMVLHPSNLLQTQCTQQLTAKPCLLRRGIIHHSDSFMQALGYLFTGTLNSKGALLRMLRETIRPELFVTLENGLMLAAFVTDDAGIIANASNAAKWVAWMKTEECKKYARLFGLRDLMRAASDVATMSEAAALRLSRELAIYKAFSKFHIYLASTEAKDASLLVDAVRHLGVHLVLWEKDGGDSSIVRMRCPATIPYSALPKGDERLVGMLLQEKNVFEPIELGSKAVLKGPSSTLQSMDNMTGALKRMMGECDAGIIPGVPETRVWIETVRSIDAAVRLVTAIPERYVWKQVVVSPDYAIIGLANEAGFVSCGRVPISGLLDLVEVLPHVKVLYQEDVAPLRPFEPSDDLQDSIIFDNLLKTFDVGGGAGIRLIDAPPIIAMRAHDEMKDIENTIRETAATWRSTKYLVGRELLRHFNTRIEPFIKQKATNDFINANIDAFPAAAQFVEEALREVAGLLGRTNVQERLMEWMTLADRSAWPFLSPNIVQRGTHEWVFSQLAVERGLPSHVVKPVDGARPKELVARDNAAAFELTWPNKIKRTREPRAAASNTAKLPWKWVETRKYSWRDWSIELPILADSAGFIKKWMEWAAAERGIPFKWSMVAFAMKVYIANVLALKEERVAMFVKQPGMLDVLRVLTRMPKATTVPKMVTMLMTKTLEERRNMLTVAAGEVLSDFDFTLAARWCGITLLIVSNVDYVKSDKDAPVLCADFKPNSENDIEVCADGPNTSTHARGSPKDLITNAILLYNEDLSTTREAIWKRPFVLLYKDVQKGGDVPRYAPVGQGLWASLRHAPKDLQHVACCLYKHKVWRTDYIQ